MQAWYTLSILYIFLTIPQPLHKLLPNHPPNHPMTTHNHYPNQFSWPTPQPPPQPSSLPASWQPPHLQQPPEELPVQSQFRQQKISEKQVQLGVPHSEIQVELDCQFNIAIWNLPEFDIADIDKCRWDKCCLDKCHLEGCHLLQMVAGPHLYILV